MPDKRCCRTYESKTAADRGPFYAQFLRRSRADSGHDAGMSDNAAINEVAQKARAYRAVTIRKVDGRSRLGRVMRETRAALLAHFDGRPTATQRILIERAVTKAGYLARLDSEALSPDGMSDHRRREYQAADNSYRLILRELGLKNAPVHQRAANLQDYTASRASSSPAALADETAAKEPATPEAAGALPDGQHAA
jgi:hypothetical protein